MPDWFVQEVKPNFKRLRPCVKSDICCLRRSSPPVAAGRCPAAEKRTDPILPGKKRVSVLMKVGTPASMRRTERRRTRRRLCTRFASMLFIGDERVGYYSDGGLEASAAFLMDMTPEIDIRSEGGFLCRGQRGGDGDPRRQRRPVGDSTTPAQLRQFRFTQLDLSKGLPMYCMTTETIDVATDDPNNPPAEPGARRPYAAGAELEFELRRPVAKLGFSPPSVQARRPNCASPD